jgi:AcrR family transcriptional regulator
MAEALNVVEDSGALLPPRRRAAPRQRDADQTKINILEAALAEFADKGLAGARVDEIAKKTSTSKHMIYYYFGNKEGLYQAVLKRAYNNFRIAEQSVDYASLDPVDAMRSLIGQTFDMHVENPLSVRIIMGENLNNGEHIGKVEGLDERRAILVTVEQILTRGVKSGQFRDGLDPLQIHMTASALSFYFIANRFTFGMIFGLDYKSAAVVTARRTEIIETVLRYCLKNVS